MKNLGIILAGILILSAISLSSCQKEDDMSSKIPVSSISEKTNDIIDNVPPEFIAAEEAKNIFESILNPCRTVPKAGAIFQFVTNICILNMAVIY